MNIKKTILSLVLLVFLSTLSYSEGVINTDLLVIGGGASGTTASVQAARMGAKVILIEETEWLGGMLTAAGVTAIDGNHQMPSGLWGEFRQKLYDYYGGPKAVETGWVSNTLFEPSVGNKMFKELANHKNIDIWYNTSWDRIKRERSRWITSIRKGNRKYTVSSKLIIDATELGDVLAYLNVPCQIGMDSRYDTGEKYAPDRANNIIQDMTYVVTLKDYGKGVDRTIPKPTGYKASEFSKSCDVSDPSLTTSPDNNCYQMIQYGRLPNDKYMINWPREGNDIYLNVIEKSKEVRKLELEKAKQHSLCFVYYIQTELGFKNLGLADDEYPTKDKLPMIPYHRESRRMKGLVTLTVNDVADRYSQKNPLYRTGIAVGDYPIDHHHLKHPTAPSIDFVNIKVPSYNVPLGSLIPEHQEGLIVAEKSISVTNIVNGATRLQPVVLTIGQAAGALAALCIMEGAEPKDVDVRKVQKALLDSKAYIMPLIDVKPWHKDFNSIQKVSATGIMKTFGVPFKWANQTWFYPEKAISEYDLLLGLKTYYPNLQQYQASGNDLTFDALSDMIQAIDTSLKEQLRSLKPNFTSEKGTLTRAQVAVLLNDVLNPFERPIDMNGNLKNL